MRGITKPHPCSGEKGAASQLYLIGQVLDQELSKNIKRSRFVTVRLLCSSLQGADLWFPSSILLFLSLISGHLITFLNPKPKQDDF